MDVVKADLASHSHNDVINDIIDALLSMFTILI